MNLLIGLGFSWLLVVPADDDSVRHQMPREPSGLGVRHIEACEMRLKDKSGSADFVGRWMYKMTVNPDGAVGTVSRLDDPVKAAQFVELADFESCLRRWRFVKPGAYDVQLHGGMSPRWSITVVNGAESMRVIIPRIPE